MKVWISEDDSNDICIDKYDCLVGEKIEIEDEIWFEYEKIIENHEKMQEILRKIYEEKRKHPRKKS